MKQYLSELFQQMVHHTIRLRQLHEEGTITLSWTLSFETTNVSEEHPDGIFHPHKDVQHIKKENIGLIEVMGLAVLPPQFETRTSRSRAFLIRRRKPDGWISSSVGRTIKKRTSWFDERYGHRCRTKICRSGFCHVYWKTLEYSSEMKKDRQRLNDLRNFIKRKKGGETNGNN